MRVFQWLQQTDRAVFFLINEKLSFPWLNQGMLVLREAITWVPLYLFMLLFFYANCRRYLLPIVVLSVLTFAMTDYTSAAIIKPFVERLRPCADPAINFSINNIAGCGGIYSMPSSHASNHFGLATFWFLVIGHALQQKWWWLWAWAAVICYAQVYVGVHFPGDILVGAALGILVGKITYLVFKRIVAIGDASLKT